MDLPKGKRLPKFYQEILENLLTYIFLCLYSSKIRCFKAEVNKRQTAVWSFLPWFKTRLSKMPQLLKSWRCSVKHRMELMNVRFVLCFDDSEEYLIDEFLIYRLMEMESSNYLYRLNYCKQGPRWQLKLSGELLNSAEFLGNLRKNHAWPTPFVVYLKKTCFLISVDYLSCSF